MHFLRSHLHAIFLVVLAILGPILGLAGVLCGALMTRNWQRRQWILDQKKQEFRELLDALGTLRDIALRYGISDSPEIPRSLQEAFYGFARISTDRIFAASYLKPDWYNPLRGSIIKVFFHLQSPKDGLELGSCCAELLKKVQNVAITELCGGYVDVPEPAESPKGGKRTDDAGPSADQTAS